MNQKIKTELGVAIILIAVATAGLFIWNCQKNQPITEIANQVLNLKKNASTNQQETNSDWQTYRNEKYGFEFQYPKTDFKLVAIDKTDSNQDEIKSGRFDLVNLKTAKEGMELFLAYIEEPLSSDSEADITHDQSEVDIMFDIIVKKTEYKDLDAWFSAFKKDYETPSGYEGGTVELKIISEQNTSIQGFQAKKYESEIVFSDTNINILSIFKNGFVYDISYNGGVKESDYNAAKVGVDEYGQKKYNEIKLEENRISYRKLLDNIVSTFKFTK